MFIVETKNTDGRKQLILSGKYNDTQSDRAQITDALRVGGLFNEGEEVHLFEGPKFYANGNGAFLTRKLGVILKTRKMKVVSHSPQLLIHERFI